MEDLARRFAELPPDQRRWLGQTLRQNGPAFNVFPLSFAQQRLWVLDQWSPGSPVYTLLAALRLTGPLHVPALARSLQAIVHRHDTLRTIFLALDGTPLQLVCPPGPVALPLLDLRALAPAAQEALLSRLLHRAARQPFDLSQGPLLRATLLRLQPHQHLLLLAMHHIIADGWSLTVLIRELAAGYAAARNGANGRGEATPPLPPLAPLPIQYTDYALWQREWWDAERAAPLLAYWRQQLAGAPPLLALPTDHPRPPVQSFRGARQLAVLAPPLVAALRAFSQARRATLFMTLLAAFAVLLARASGQRDLVVGAPIAGRTRPETEHLIGCFLNTLALRIDLRGQPTFAALLAHVQAVCLAAYAHQDLPFEQLLEELQLARDPSHTPLFQVFFNMLNYPSDPIELADLMIETLPPPEVTAKFDLTLYLTEQGDEIQLELVYNADLFGAARMEELLAQYRQLLAHVVEQPDQPIDHISLVTPAARAYLPDPTARLDAGWDGGVHASLSRQAQQSPERQAIVDAYESWTYGELERMSNQLAHKLIAQGIRPQDVVAIYGYRSAALVWALFGILKAGATFMILDPAYPPPRLIEYLHTARPRGWIEIAAAGTCPDELADCVIELVGQRRVTLPRRDMALAQGLLAGYSCDDPGIALEPDDRACITFTSGSMGRPKGIIGRHGPLAHFLPWQSQVFGLGETDRFSMLSGLSHDPLQRDVFTPLWLGATLCIPHPPDITTPGKLADWMRKEAITVAHLTPALAQVLTRPTPASAPRPIPSLRYTFIVGDVLTKPDIARIRALAPAVTCVNFYGSTETQRAVAYYVVPDDEALPDDEAAPQRFKEILPLGRGMKDVQLLVLNAARQLAGVGEIGEIYVRSPHLAQGYIDDPALTAERFVPNPFGDCKLQIADCRLADSSICNLQSTICNRLYRTGDLGRYRPDGNVEFCGRADDQVKVRGFRVEPGEIESLLHQHVAVREAVVVAREDVPGDKRLVAYVVPTNDERPTTNDRPPKIEDRASQAHGSLSSILYPLSSELRSFLAARLPAYMIPAAFVLLDALPLTPNGKLDRRALPTPEHPQRAQMEGYVAPQTELEQLIASVWQTVLHVKTVGTNDNFFELGGNSVQMIQVCGALHEALKRDLSIVELFQYPTVGSLSRYLGQQHAEQPPREIMDRVKKQRQALDRQKHLRSR